MLKDVRKEQPLRLKLDPQQKQAGLWPTPGFIHGRASLELDRWGEHGAMNLSDAHVDLR